MDLKERFLKYVSYDTQSSEESTTFPSTEKQKVLLAALRDEMEALGMTEVTMDQYGYVMGTVPASKGCENAPVIGFIAHQTSLYTAFGLLAFLVLLQSIIAAYVYRHILD